MQQDTKKKTKQHETWAPHEWVYADGTTRGPTIKRHRKAAQEATRAIDRMLRN